MGSAADPFIISQDNGASWTASGIQSEGLVGLPANFQSWGVFYFPKIDGFVLNIKLQGDIIIATADQYAPSASLTWAFYENVLPTHDYRHYAVSNNNILVGRDFNANDVNLYYSADAQTWTNLVAPYQWNDLAANPDDGFFFVSKKDSLTASESKCRRYNETDWSFADVCDSTGVTGLASAEILRMDYHSKERRLFAVTDVSPFILYSDDNGDTWTGVTAASGTPTSVAGPLEYIPPIDRLVLVDPGQTSAYSDDGGLSWHFDGTFPHVPHNSALSDEGDKVLFTSWNANLGVFSTNGTSVSSELSGNAIAYYGIATSQCSSTITPAPTTSPTASPI